MSTIQNVCPFNAISSLNETVCDVTLLRPFADEKICTGCGLCESRCPIEGTAAIGVFNIGEERITSGSYITEEKVRLRACEEKIEDIPAGFILEEQLILLLLFLVITSDKSLF